MSQVATVAAQRSSDTGTDTLGDVEINAQSVLEASTQGAAEYPAHCVHVQPGVGLMSPALVGHYPLVDFVEDARASAAEGTVLLNSAWEDGWVIAGGAPSQIVASGTNYISASVNANSGILGQNVGGYSESIIFSAVPGLFIGASNLRLDPSDDLIVSGNFTFRSQEPAEASTEGMDASTRHVERESVEFDALLSQIRQDYEQLPESEWFKKVYVGKSLGDVIREL